MRNILFVLFALCFVSSSAFAQEGDKFISAAMTAATKVTAANVIVLNGDVIDNMCAGMNKNALAEFVKTHTKACALKPACMDSGYSIFAGGKLYRFADDSNTMVAEFLKKVDSKLQVSATTVQVGDELSLVSIENQK